MNISSIFQGISDGLSGLFYFRKQVYDQRHQKLQIVWGRLRGEYLPNLRLRVSTDYKIGLGVYQGDIVILRHTGMELQGYWVIEKLQPSDLGRIDIQAHSKLCEDVKRLCYVLQDSQSCQQKLDLQTKDEITQPIVDSHNAEHDSTKSLNEGEANNAEFPRRQEELLEENQEYQQLQKDETREQRIDVSMKSSLRKFTDLLKLFDNYNPTDLEIERTLKDLGYHKVDLPSLLSQMTAIGDEEINKAWTNDVVYREDIEAGIMRQGLVFKNDDKWEIVEENEE